MENKEFFNLKILYVEDDENAIEPMRNFLKRRFAKVMIADSGSNGYKKFCETVPDVIISDLLMENTSGMEMIKRIRDTGYKNPIIITSALRDSDSILKTVDLGITKYIVKPIDLKELELCLINVCKVLVKEQRKSIFLELEEKKVKESNISYAVSAIIKKHSGKGPKNVKVFIGADRIELSCVQTLTVLETTLLKTKNNASFIEHLRILLYQEMKVELELAVSKEMGIQMMLETVKSDCAWDIDYFTLIPK